MTNSSWAELGLVIHLVGRVHEPEGRSNEEQQGADEHDRGGGVQGAVANRQEGDERACRRRRENEPFVHLLPSGRTSIHRIAAPD
jgi:hypothetical protein